MSNSEIFKTVMRGYKKDEVIAYIAGLNEEMKRLEAEGERKNAQIERLSEDYEALKQTPSGPTEEEIEQIKAETRDETVKLLGAEYAVKLAKQQAEFDRELAEKLEEAQAKNEKLSEIEQKVKEYEEYKDALTGLMIQARKNADEILCQAREEARQIRLKAQAEISEFNADFGALKQNIGATKNDIQRNLDDAAAALNIFDLRLSMIQKNIDDATNAFNSSDPVEQDSEN